MDETNLLTASSAMSSAVALLLTCLRAQATMLKSKRSTNRRHASSSACCNFSRNFSSSTSVVALPHSYNRDSEQLVTPEKVSAVQKCPYQYVSCSSHARSPVQSRRKFPWTTT